MKFYTAEVPIHSEFVSEYDNHDTSTYMEFEFQTSIEIKGMNCTVRYNEKEKSILIDRIEASSEIEAFIIVKSIIPMIVNIISIYIQRKNINQHYGHARIKWYKGEIMITPGDHYPRASSSTTITTKVSLAV